MENKQNITTSFGFSQASINDLFISHAGEYPAPTMVLHDKDFHADDVVAAAMGFCFREDFNWARIKIVRTRKEEDFAKGGLLVDVGEGEFDHHGPRAGIDPDGIPWSGVSRLWHHLVEVNGLQNSRPHQIFKQRVLDPLSKIDNGVKLDEGETSSFSWVKTFNPGYDDDTDITTAFIEAVKTAKNILRAAWKKACADAKGEEIVEAIVRLASVGLPIVTVPKGLDSLWPRMLAETHAIFVIIPTEEGYMLRCVPKNKKDTFSRKIGLPESWCGKRGEALAEETGLDDAIFCHHKGFIAGFKTKKSAYLAGRLAMLMAEDSGEDGEIEQD